MIVKWQKTFQHLLLCTEFDNIYALQVILDVVILYGTGLIELLLILDQKQRKTKSAAAKKKFYFALKFYLIAYSIGYMRNRMPGMR